MKDATYTIPTYTADEQLALKVSVSLYPYQVQLIRSFASESRRSFSNALQVIIEDWAGQKRSSPTEAA